MKGAKDAASSRKAFRNLLKSLSRRHKPNPVKHGKSSIEHLVYVILSQRNPERRASGAIRDLKALFAGWNEVRVSSVLEIGEVLRAHNILSPLQKAEQVIRALGRTFSDVHKVRLEELGRDDAEDTRLYLARKLGLPGNVVADYIFSAFGYGRIPIDDSVGRLLHRLGFVAAKHEFPKLEKTLSDGLTSRECADAYRILDAFATETCSEKDPACARCHLFSQCPEGQARKAAAEAAKLAPPPEEKPKPAEVAPKPVAPAPKPAAAAAGAAKPAVKPPQKPVAAPRPPAKPAAKPAPRQPAHPPRKPAAKHPARPPARPAKPAGKKPKR